MIFRLLFVFLFIISTGSSYLAGQIGELKPEIGEVNHKILHGLLGGVSGGITSSLLNKSFEDGAVSGALGGVVSEVMADMLSPDLTQEEFIDQFVEKAERSAKWGEFTGTLSAFLAGYDPQIANQVASNAVENNNLKTLFLALTAATTAYEAYQIHQTYEREGAEAALKHLGISIVAGVAGGVAVKAVFKVGKVVYPTLKEAYKAALVNKPILRSSLTKLEGKLGSIESGVQTKTNSNPKQQTYKITDKNTDPRLPVGSRHSGQDPKYFTQNQPTSIGGRHYSGHALDRMRERGLKPSVVEETIRNGVVQPSEEIGKRLYYSAKNNVSVVTDAASGRVITARFGGFNG